MTVTTSPNDTGEIAVGEKTRDLSLHAVGIPELNRLAAGETVVLGQPPVTALPPADQPASPVPPRYRGGHRKGDPAWTWALIGAGSVLAVEAVIALVVRVVIW